MILVPYFLSYRSQYILLHASATSKSNLKPLVQAKNILPKNTKYAHVSMYSFGRAVFTKNSRGSSYETKNERGQKGENRQVLISI